MSFSGNLRRNTLEHRGEGVDGGREKWSRERSVISLLLRLLHHTVTHPSIPHPLPLVQGFRCLVWIQLSRPHSTSPTISFTIEISFPLFNLNLLAVFIFVIHCLGSLRWRCSLLLTIFNVTSLPCAKPWWDYISRSNAFRSKRGYHRTQSERTLTKEKDWFKAVMPSTST